VRVKLNALGGQAIDKFGNKKQPRSHAKTQRSAKSAKNSKSFDHQKLFFAIFALLCAFA
jgi:hypothetical protein